LPSPRCHSPAHGVKASVFAGYWRSPARGVKASVFAGYWRSAARHRQSRARRARVPRTGSKLRSSRMSTSPAHGVKASVFADEQGTRAGSKLRSSHRSVAQPESRARGHSFGLRASPAESRGAESSARGVRAGSKLRSSRGIGDPPPDTGLLSPDRCRLPRHGESLGAGSQLRSSRG
jgi:hypothetical protein